MRSNQALKAWYREINTRFFDSELPDNVCVRWATAEEEEEHQGYIAWADKAANDYHKYEIILYRRFNRSLTITLATLVHEMIHIATELKDNHGPAFERWRKVLSDRGIFKKGALRKNLTLF